MCVCVLFCFFNSIAQWGVEEDNTSMSKVVKGKEKSVAKMEKTEKFAEEEDNESTESFQN